MQCQRLIENDPDLLFTSFRRAPARPLIRAEDRFDGKTGIFRTDFDRGNVSKIKPSMVASRLSIGWTHTHYPLPHISILARARAVAGASGLKGHKEGDPDHRKQAIAGPGTVRLRKLQTTATKRDNRFPGTAVRSSTRK